MKILYLGPRREKIISFIESGGDTVQHYEQKLDGTESLFNEVDLILSYDRFGASNTGVQPQGQIVDMEV